MGSKNLPLLLRTAWYLESASAFVMAIIRQPPTRLPSFTALLPTVYEISLADFYQELSLNGSVPSNIVFDGREALGLARAWAENCEWNIRGRFIM